jgi:hypothetical protein
MQHQMSNVLLDEAQRTRNDKESGQNGNSAAIKISTVITRTSVSAAGKGITSNTRQSKSLSRVSARGFTGSHVVEIGDLQSANLAGVDGSAVIPTWGLSSPGVDLLATYLDIHRVSGAQIFDFIPTNGDLFQRIGNSDSFIEESHLGADKGQMKDVGDQSAPCTCRQNATKTFGKETLSNKSGAENVDSASKEVTTSRTVHLRITHTSSLSRKVLR